LGKYAYQLLIFSPPLILHDPIDSGKKGVVLSHAHVLSGMDPGPLLTNQDTACRDLLASVSFNAQALAGTVPVVS